ncbi:MAG: response regulator transcription factor [Bacteroidetes bacterium]|nr:response regulator transcription factor [Bacteroidota bacterium]
MTEEIKVLLVDDHQIIIDGLQSLIENAEGIRVISQANNGREALEILKILDVDVVLMDIDMPVMNGLDAAKIIHENYEATKVIILSMHGEKALVKELLKMGVDGYLLKNASKDELLNAIKIVAAGDRYFSSDVTVSLLNNEPANSKTLTKSGLKLTVREIEILKLIAEGFTNKEIGEQLFISHRTVDTHRTNLMKKLNINNVAGLISFAIKNDIIQ